MMFISCQDVTNKNEVIATQPSLDSLKVCSDDESEARIRQNAMSKRRYIYRGNVFLPGSETATSRLHFSSRMIKAPQAAVVCGNDISTPRLCFDAFVKQATTRYEQALRKEPVKARGRLIKIKIRAIEKDKPSPSAPRECSGNRHES